MKCRVATVFGDHFQLRVFPVPQARIKGFGNFGRSVRVSVTTESGWWEGISAIVSGSEGFISRSTAYVRKPKLNSVVTGPTGMFVIIQQLEVVGGGHCARRSQPAAPSTLPIAIKIPRSRSWGLGGQPGI